MVLSVINLNVNSCRNWESDVPLCSHPLVGEGITDLIFNPMNWCQICAVDSRSLTIWNVEKCGDSHLIKPR